jgi:hypothetical protein
VLARALRAPTRRNRQALAELLTRAVDREELRPDLDVERTVDLLWGPIYYRFVVSLIEDEPIAADYVESVVDELWPALQS